MQLYLTKLLLSISLVFFIGSCSTPKHLKPLKSGEKTTLSKDNFNPIFKGDFKSFLFKTTMSYSDKFELGGMLMLKQITVGNYRAIFMTKFGMTMFDFEFGNSGFVVHKALEQMDKKIFLQIIEQDFGMLLTPGILGDKATIFKKEKAPKKKKVVKIKMDKKTYYFVQGGDNQFTEIHRGQKVSIKLGKYIKKIPHSIDIQHHNMPLNMKLTLLKH
jgi:hypothetical protein